MSKQTPTEKKDPSKAKKIYNIVSTVVIAVIFVFLTVVVALMLWQRKSGGDSAIFGYYVFDVITDSMSGTIEPNEVIISKKVENAEELKVGDIITFVAPSGEFRGHNITHRIYEIESENGVVKYFKTKGDKKGAPVDDWQLKPENIKAKFVRKSPFIAGLKGFLSNWYGYVLLIALPIALVAVMIILGIVKDKLAAERNKAETDKSISVDNLSEEKKQEILDELMRSLKTDGGTDTIETVNDEKNDDNGADGGNI